VPERDVTTPLGRQLTLMNSAYILRQIYEGDVGERLAPGHITSLNPLRPDNAPDAWELAALEAFVAGKEQVSEVVPIGGRPHFRLMQRMTVEPQCLKCHGAQDYKLGDVRGGISVAVDLAPYMAADAAMTSPLALTHASIWLLGLLGIVAGSRQIRERFRERLEVEKALRLDEARLEALLQLNQKSREPLAELIHFAMEESVRLTGSQVGYVALVNEDESVLTMHAWSETAMRQCAMQDKPRVYPVVATGLWGEAVRRRQPMITNDYASLDSNKKGLPEDHVPLTRHMNVPIFDGERIVIVAGVGNKPGEYDESDVRQVTLLMSELWRITQRQQAEVAVRRGEEMYRSLVEHLPQRSAPAARRVRGQSSHCRRRTPNSDP
jgi:PAS domain-containing protein